MRRRALVVKKPGTIGIVERPALEPGTGKVVIRPAYCGICGTDLELYRGDIDPAYVRYPLTLGHEWSGTVEAIGAGVENVALGDRCVAECIVPCGRCARCRSGETNVCEFYDELGFTREGGAGDQVLVPARLVHRLEPAVSLLDAALVEPSSVVLRALEKAEPGQGSRVLVVGDGTIGLLAAYLVGLWEPSAVTMLGRRPEQAEMAQSVGVTSFVTDDDVDGGFDIAVEAAGVPEAISTTIGLVRRGGTVALLGLPPSGQRVAFGRDGSSRTASRSRTMPRRSPRSRPPRACAARSCSRSAARTADGGDPTRGSDEGLLERDEAISTLDLQIADGVFVVLVGPSGCEKTVCCA